MRDIVRFMRSVYHYCWALGSAAMFGFPSRHLKVIGVTGTKGKSTTLALLAHILRKTGKSVALLSSVDVIIGDAHKKNLTGNTMPGRLFIQRFLSRAKKAGCAYALIEVTSQGIVQHRHRFINWSSAGFLDIHPEHIESHGSFERYLAAKVKFFSYVASHARSPHFFVHDADQHADAFLAVVGAHPVHLFNINDVDRSHVPVSLGGEFNLVNISAALALAQQEGISRDQALEALEDFSGLAGRMEYVQREPFAVVVDYAHTPDSLEAVYKHLSSLGGKLICVLGSMGGDRDKWKRPKFGEIVSAYCDKIILTNEDPVDEPPEKIIDDIAEGVSKEKAECLYKIVDRKEAIARALSFAETGDVVAITGKGSEEYIRVKGGKRIYWSDKGVVEELLSARSQDFSDIDKAQ